MKRNYKKNFLGLSLVTAMLLGSSAYAGLIKTDANLSNIVIDDYKQFGFFGWNLENVNVNITDLDYDPISKSFDPDTGTYDPMVVGDSFESEIISTEDNITIMGRLHGKDWPVGEPAGIKIINGDIDVEHGKPVNCIINTSYIGDDLNDNQTHYLNDNDPIPVICSSPFQTHKRFKVNLQPSTIIGDGEYGKPVDLVFNLDPSDLNETVTRYQVFQKINNYTGKRLDGYMIEVLDENGTKNPALTLSLGIGEGIYPSDPTRTNIWEVEDMANMSHGLWGPVDKHFDAPGFFDATRVYYPVGLSEGDQTISYFGPMQGGNYQDIFGNWLTVEWAPTGMFYDDDNDPLTDAELVAFFGVAPGYTELGWYKNTVDPVTFEYTWSLATIEDYSTWNDSLYATGVIEDTLNLGLNYIVEVGKNADIGETFTIRITPHVAPTDQQVAPSYVGVTPTYNINSTGTIAIYPNPIFIPGNDVTVAVGDTDLNIDAQAIDEVNVTVINDNGDEENITLTETDANSSVFNGTLSTIVDGTNTPDNGTMTVAEGTVVTAIYVDTDNGLGGTDVEINASTTAHTVALPIANAGEDQTVPLNGSIILTGTVTYVDPYAEIVSYKWKDGQTLLASTPSFTYEPTSEGEHNLTFIITDNYGGVAKDYVTVTVTPAEDPSSGGGGGCSYNPNSKNFDMTLLLMMAFGLLYPIRRRFIK